MKKSKLLKILGINLGLATAIATPVVLAGSCALNSLKDFTFYFVEVNDVHPEFNIVNETDVVQFTIGVIDKTVTNIQYTISLEQSESVISLEQIAANTYKIVQVANGYAEIHVDGTFKNKMGQKIQCSIVGAVDVTCFPDPE
ncbi:hypothetical protein Barb6_01830 [Bacteroidales bacterium Barb6]|nr:hypothetical protein Barb6_01830 [Bacteroidales bacterium Barb6]OAV70552.1 hypothetical protein Barb4_01277 [Bacteroidales bacterium Barb4]